MHLIWLLLALPFHSLVDSAPAAISLQPPIKYWGPSWAASCARGTSIVVSCRVDIKETDKDRTKNTNDAKSSSSSEISSNNGILLLMRSSAPATVTSNLRYKPNSELQQQSRRLTTTITSNYTNVPPILIRVMPLQEFGSIPESNSFWTPLGTHALCSMTGLSSDVNHVSRVVQQKIQTYRTDYDSGSFPVASSLTQALSRTVREAALFQGGRPYGLQALIVGKQQQQQQQQQTNINKRPPLYVYTVDPSGAWRCWGSGCTAIGRMAETVRRNLQEQLLPTIAEMKVKFQATNLHPQVALEIAMKTSLQASQSASSNQDNDLYEAVLFWVDSVTGECHLATMDPTAIQSCRDRIGESLQKEIIKK